MHDIALSASKLPPYVWQGLVVSPHDLLEHGLIKEISATSFFSLAFSASISLNLLP